MFFSSCKTAVHSQLWEPRWEIVTFSQKEKFSFETLVISQIGSLWVVHLLYFIYLVSLFIIFSFFYYHYFTFHQTQEYLSANISEGSPSSVVLADWLFHEVVMATARIDYVAPWWTYWLHNFPHFNFFFQTVDSTFKPEEASYQQVGNCSCG